MSFWLVAATIAGLTLPDPTTPLDADACARIALSRSGQVYEANAKVAQFKGLLAEVESIYYPKLFGLAFVAPMFSVRGGALSSRLSERFTRLQHFGPYAHLEATLAQPLYTFGRGEAGTRAAENRLEVEKARVRETENRVALETRRLYYLRLFARSMIPSLRNADKILDEAQAKAKELYDEASGDVTQTDLSKLAYGGTVVKRYLEIATRGAKLAEGGLKHTMGIAMDVPLTFADKRLKKLKETDDTSLEAYLLLAKDNRPEWKQILHGKEAALSLEKAERLANMPLFFLAGQFAMDWTNMRTDSQNPYHFDQFNQILGGIALGLQFNLDPAQAAAKGDKAKALYDQVVGLERFAKTGIAIQVTKAYEERAQWQVNSGHTRAGMKAAQKWMTFAASAFATGTGEAKDLLEGLGAFLQAKQAYYEALQSFYTSDAELRYAVGGR